VAIQYILVFIWVSFNGGVYTHNGDLDGFAVDSARYDPIAVVGDRQNIVGELLRDQEANSITVVS